jgi:hypothetical protein
VIALGYGLDDRGFKSRKGLGIFLFTTASRPALGSTQPPIQWVPGALSLGCRGPGAKLTTHLHLAPRSRMRGAIPPLPQYDFMAWCSVNAQGQVSFNFNFISVTFAVNCAPLWTLHFISLELKLCFVQFRRSGFL